MAEHSRPDLGKFMNAILWKPDPRVLRHVSGCLYDERSRQIRLGYTGAQDGAHGPADWVMILDRQLGLALPESPARQDGLHPNLVHWERQLLRLHATVYAALEQLYLQHPQLLEKVAPAREGDEGGQS